MSGNVGIIRMGNSTVAWSAIPRRARTRDVRPISVLIFWMSRGFDSGRILISRAGILMSMGGDSHVHGELPGNVESTNLSRDNLSREIGRTFPKNLCGTAECTIPVAESGPGLSRAFWS